MRSSLLVGAVLLALVVAPVGGVAAHPSTAASAGSTVESGAPMVAETRDGPASAGDACEAVAGGPQREHPEGDPLGWENGCWHDDPIAVTVTDGLNGTELPAVVARTMARVEYVRRLEFERTVPVEVVSRASFRAETERRYANLSTARRRHLNVKHEAAFFVPEDDDAVAQLAANRGGSVLGYYSTTEDRIVVVSDADGPLRVDGPTLVHELAHALQDQQFNLSRYERTTTEQANAVSGLLEGDPTYTEYLYDRRCDREWDCPTRAADAPTPPGAGFDWGIYFMGYQPYSDGGAFVAALRERGGWAAVDAAYANPPASTEQVIHPEKYPGERPANVTVADRSTDGWRVLRLEGGVDHAAYGEAGLASMFIAPTFEHGDAVFVSRGDVLTGADLHPVDYDLPATAGWAGDRLYPYVRNGSAAPNETGYVWKTVWDTPADARAFAAAYLRLLAYHGADPVPGHLDTYRIPDDAPFGDAFYVNRTGRTVVLVNAPTVADLPAIRRGAAPEVPPTVSPTAMEASPSAAPTATASPGPRASPASPGVSSTTTPGLGGVPTLVALLVAALLTRER